MVNDFARYMEMQSVALESELPRLPSFTPDEIEYAVSAGLVGRSPVSLHRPEGYVFWSRDPLSELGVSLTAEKIVRYNCSDGKSELVGTVNNLITIDGVPLEPRIAAAALAYGRDFGLVEELDIGGVSVFVLCEKYRGTVRPLSGV